MLLVDSLKKKFPLKSKARKSSFKVFHQQKTCFDQLLFTQRLTRDFSLFLSSIQKNVRYKLTQFHINFSRNISNALDFFTVHFRGNSSCKHLELLSKTLKKSFFLNYEKKVKQHIK